MRVGTVPRAPQQRLAVRLVLSLTANHTKDQNSILETHGANWQAILEGQKACTPWGVKRLRRVILGGKFSPSRRVGRWRAYVVWYSP